MSSGRDAIAGSCRHLLCKGGTKSTSTTRSNQVGADTLQYEYMELKSSPQLVHSPCLMWFCTRPCTEQQ